MGIKAAVKIHIKAMLFQKPVNNVMEDCFPVVTLITDEHVWFVAVLIT